MPALADFKRPIGTPPSAYGQMLPLVQSTMTGKSRLFREMGIASGQLEDGGEASLITLTMRVGDERAFPPGDDRLRAVLAGERAVGLGVAVVHFLETITKSLRDLDPRYHTEWLRNFAQAQ